MRAAVAGGLVFKGHMKEAGALAVVVVAVQDCLVLHLQETREVRVEPILAAVVEELITKATILALAVRVLLSFPSPLQNGQIHIQAP